MGDQEQTYLIALGGNMPSHAGPPARTLQAALEALTQSGVKIEAVSRLYETPCFPAGAGPDYVNAAARLRSGLCPAAFLALLHDVEARFGRTRETRWGMRTLDLDLLAAGREILPDRSTYDSWQDLPQSEQRLRAPSELILPHPRLSERAFVLVPLAEIAPDWVHPVSGQSVAEMCAALPAAERAEVRALI